MPRRYQLIFDLFALAVIVFLCVDLLYMIITVKLGNIAPQGNSVAHLPNIEGHRKPPLDHYRAIMKRNIFGSEEAPQKIEEEQVVALRPTSLKVALLGTVVGDQQSAVAVIEDINKKEQGLYKVGDSVQSAVLKRILRGKVILRVGDRDEILTIEEAAASRAKQQPSMSKPKEMSSRITVGRSDLQESLTNLHQLLSQARIRPHFQDGKADGLAVTNIRPGSLFEKLGLKNGDIVQGIDGRTITSPDDVLEVYNKLTSGSNVAVQIKRKGEQRVINYTFR